MWLDNKVASIGESDRDRSPNKHMKDASYLVQSKTRYPVHQCHHVTEKAYAGKRSMQ